MIENIKILKFFADYIESQLGIVYTETNYYQLEHRLNDIKSQLGFSSLEELYQKAQGSIDGQFKSLLLDLATNNETSFFRDPHVFKTIREFIIPEIQKNGIKTSLNIWSAASSSGQEIYSVIMELDAAREEGQNIPILRILASDVSDTILKKAKEGKYSQLEVQRGLPARNLIKYFDKAEDDKWKLKSQYQQGIEFKKINLLSNWGLIGPFDIVLCRNVLIYQNVENKIKVVKEIYNHLNPGGFLILGAAESLFGISGDFKQVVYNSTVVYQKI